MFLFEGDGVVGGSEDGADGLNPCISRTRDGGRLEGGGVVNVYAGIEAVGDGVVVVHDVVEIVDG